MDLYSRISDISANSIMVFLKCMELENYSKAAESLSFTPSMISKTIRKMEEKLGLVLFRRHGRRVVPTPAAFALQREWRLALSAIETGVENAYAVQAGATAPIRFGLIDDSEYAEQIFLERARTFDPTLSSIVVEKADMHALPDLLKRGRYDMVLTALHEFDQFDHSGIESRLIEYTKLAIFIPKGHPLYEKEYLKMDDFRPHSFVVMDPLTNTGYYDMFLKAFKEWGFDPRIANTVLNASSMRFSLEMGQHLVCGDSMICQWDNDHIRKYEVDVPFISGLQLAWQRRFEDERLLRLADALCTPPE